MTRSSLRSSGSSLRARHYEYQVRRREMVSTFQTYHVLNNGVQQIRRDIEFFLGWMARELEVVGFQPGLIGVDESIGGGLFRHDLGDLEGMRRGPKMRLEWIWRNDEELGRVQYLISLELFSYAALLVLIAPVVRREMVLTSPDHTMPRTAFVLVWGRWGRLSQKCMKSSSWT